MKRGWLIVLLLSLGLNLGFGLHLLRVAPQPSAGPPLPEREADQAQVERFMQRRLDRMAERLDLTVSQRDALWALHREHGEDVFARRQELQQARSALHELLSAAEPTLPGVHDAQRQISRLQAALDSVVVDVMYRERAILTPQQREAYRGLFPAAGEGPRLRRDHPGGRRGERMRQSEEL
jgi:Spy/CpxP family protein refolding chaperone